MGSQAKAVGTLPESIRAYMHIIFILISTQRYIYAYFLSPRIVAFCIYFIYMFIRLEDVCSFRVTFALALQFVVSCLIYLCIFYFTYDICFFRARPCHARTYNITCDGALGVIYVHHTAYVLIKYTMDAIYLYRPRGTTITRGKRPVAAESCEHDPRDVTVTVREETAREIIVRKITAGLWQTACGPKLPQSDAYRIVQRREPRCVLRVMVVSLYVTGYCFFFSE